MDNTNAGHKLFVLDTNILMHDPTAIYNFAEHDVYIPMVVLEELDDHKTGTSELARNVRQTNRILVELMNSATPAEVALGLLIPSYMDSTTNPKGRLFFSNR